MAPPSPRRPQPGREKKKDRSFPCSPGPSHTATGSPLRMRAAASPQCYPIIGSSGRAPNPRPGRAHGGNLQRESSRFIPRGARASPQEPEAEAPPSCRRQAPASESARPAPGRWKSERADRRQSRPGHLAPDEAAAWREFVRIQYRVSSVRPGGSALEALALPGPEPAAGRWPAPSSARARVPPRGVGATPAGRARCGRWDRRGARVGQSMGRAGRPGVGIARSGHAGAVRLAVSGLVAGRSGMDDEANALPADRGVRTDRLVRGRAPEAD